MLQKLNERIQGVVAWLVILLIAVTFTIFGLDYYLQSHQTSNARVSVNEQPISNQLFETNYRRARAQQDLAQMTAADEKKLQSQVLSQLISNEVTLQSARKFGFEVSVNQANAAILNIPQFQQDGHFSSERYQQALNGALFTPETFQNEVRQGMLVNQQRFAFVGSSFALPDEVSRFVRLYMQTRDYDYVTITSSNFIKQATIAQEDIVAYYEKHKNEFMTPEQVSIDYITLSMQELKSKIKISKDEIGKYYEENKDHYLTPAQWQVAHILYAIPANASQSEVEQVKNKALNAYKQLEKKPNLFEDFVASQSDDKISIANKGMLPWITAGQNEFDKALLTLTKPGQISPPIRTKHGFELFKLVAYKPVITKPLSEVEETIQDQLLTESAQTKYAQALEQLSDLSYQTPDSLSPVSDALKIKIQKSESFSNLGGQSPLTKNKLIINAAFSHDVLELSNNSEPIQLDNDAVVVLRVNQHLPSKKQSLSAVQEQIQNILAKKQAEAKAKDLGSNLLNPVENEKQRTMMSSNQLKWSSVKRSARDNADTNTLINELAFNLSKPESREGLVLENGDYVVVRLKSINDGDLSTLDKEHKDSLIQQIEASYGMMDYDLYVNNLVKKAKVEKL
jgi:peptidyl-prolyl cis-trans isomerase D